MMQVLVATKALNSYYGASHILRGIDFTVARGETVGLMGRNGMGKSTLLKSIMGLVKPRTGKVDIMGRDMTGRAPYEIAQLGVAYVPEGRGIFTRMSIDENLRMGAYLRKDREVEADIEAVYQRFPRLKERRLQLAGTLSGGEQQMVAMGRALLARPKVLLLDEPSMGLSPLMVDKIFDVIRDVSQQGVTVLLVEQNAHRALEMADRAYVMDSGEMVLQGLACDLLGDPQVQAAYLGA